MVGRTHGQHTIPITFGLKMAGYALEVDRHLERLFECKSRFVGNSQVRLELVLHW